MHANLTFCRRAYRLLRIFSPGLGHLRVDEAKTSRTADELARRISLERVIDARRLLARAYLLVSGVCPFHSRAQHRSPFHHVEATEEYCGASAALHRVHDTKASLASIAAPLSSHTASRAGADSLRELLCRVDALLSAKATLVLIAFLGLAQPDEGGQPACLAAKTSYTICSSSKMRQARFLGLIFSR